MGPIGWSYGSTLVGETPYGMASEDQEEPFYRLALAV